jgi:nucleoside-diphosphate-sugar epimerase
MHVLMTGSSGLIGSALVPYLRNCGHEVTCLARSDRYPTLEGALKNLFSS